MAGTLLDPQLQNDPRRTKRLRWAKRLALPLMPALLVGAADPKFAGQRLHIQAGSSTGCGSRPSFCSGWMLTRCRISQSVGLVCCLEQHNWQPEAVALAVTLRPAMKPLLR